MRTSLAERLYISRLIAREALRRLLHGLACPRRNISRWFARIPRRLLIAPSDIRTADPTIADDIYAGYFSFAGKIINTHGCSPFETPPPSQAWSDTLEGFGWLRHLRAADTPLSRANARALVTDWLDWANRGRANWTQPVASRRVLSWLSHSPLILEDADIGFYRRVMKSLGLHAVNLRDEGGVQNSPAERLTAMIAVAALGLCSEGLGALQRRSTASLAAEIAWQILPDGGHISRNPQVILDLLLDLLPLRQAYAARGLAAPASLLNAIDRMLPMLRLFRLGDGSLGLFNGMSVTAQHQLAAALAHDEARAAALLDAPYSGYQRMEAQDAILIMDAGLPPKSAFSCAAHAGCLAFEFSTGGYRLIVNCGAPAANYSASRPAARLSAAHSTLSLGDTSSCKFAEDGGAMRLIAGQIVSGPRHISVSRTESVDDSIISASHDGYAPAFGLIHQRTLALSRDGASLCGCDSLVATDRSAKPAPCAIRFHLHPATRLEALPDGDIIIDLPDGARWLFRANAPASLEESIFFANLDRPRSSRQILIQIQAGDATSVDWSFDRVGDHAQNE